MVPGLELRPRFRVPGSADVKRVAPGGGRFSQMSSAGSRDATAAIERLRSREASDNIVMTFEKGTEGTWPGTTPTARR